MKYTSKNLAVFSFEKLLYLRTLNKLPANLIRLGKSIDRIISQLIWSMFKVLSNH